MSASDGAGQSVLSLDEAGVEQALDLGTASAWVEEGYRAMGRGETETVARDRLYFDSGALHWLGGHLRSAGLVGLKLYSTVESPAGERRSSRLVVFDTRTGANVAVVASYHLSLVRTALSTAVATRYLAPVGAQTLGIIGTGPTALPQLLAVAKERPFKRVLVHSRTPQRREGLAEEAQGLLGMPCEAMSSAEPLVRESDVLITATDSRVPVLETEWIRPGSLINAIGSNYAANRELPASAVRDAGRVVVDSLEAARREAGDLVLAVEEGAVGWDSFVELGAVVARGTVDPPESRSWTVFKSVGIAVLDLAMVASLLGQSLPDRPAS